jgi:pyruvate/2-oxoglutarate dehydrogenase complex dihydrolipoamide acyltransferase (E2) component
VVDGVVEVRPSLVLRYSYDERVEDGFYAASAIALVRDWIEDPASWIAG